MAKASKVEDVATIQDQEAQANGETPTPEPEPILLDINVDSYGELFGTGDSSTVQLETLKGIHGMPYQFLRDTDRLISEIDSSVNFPYGRKYTERIVNKMPLLLMSPCSPSFLDGFTNKTKQSILKKTADVVGGGDSSELDSILENENGRYYTCKFNYKDYYDYVNGMCWSSAIYLGIGNEKIYGKDYKSYDWSTYVNDGLKGWFSGSEYVCFYVDAETQISDNFSNSTGQSMLDSGVNKLSDMGKEIGFLLNSGNAATRFDAIDPANQEATFEQISSVLPNFTPAGLLDRVKSGAVTIMSGGGLIFPEIWQDSDYSKSYDISIKLNSPDGDTQSIYRNVLVPMWHLLGFVLPLQSGANGYTAPFITKAFYKGIMNVDMGMVTDMSIQKGNDGSWNIDGLPTEVEIRFTIKDLYQILTMTKWKDTIMFMNNTPYLDFIANTCGVVLNSPEILRKTQMYGMLYKNKVTKVPRAIQLGLTQKISNTLMKALGN